MRICDLAAANDLICRRAELLVWRRALVRGDFVVSIGGKPIDGLGLAAIKAQLFDFIEQDVAGNAAQLAELGVELDDAEETAGVSPLRVETARGLGTTR